MQRRLNKRKVRSANSATAGLLDLDSSFVQRGCQDFARGWARNSEKIIFRWHSWWNSYAINSDKAIGLYIFSGVDNLIRVIYKTALITYKALQTGQPVYLRDLLHYHQPARTLRSSSQLLLYHPAARTNFQSKAFSIAAPTVWNSLSSSTISSTTITTFKAHLKTELFAAAYDSV